MISSSARCSESRPCLAMRMKKRASQSGNVLPDEQQVARLQFVEEHVRALRFRLNRGEKFQRVLLRDDVVRRRRHLAEQVKDGGCAALARIHGNVRVGVGRVGERNGAVFAAEAFLIEGLRDQRISGRRDEEVEVPDAREHAQDRRHGGRELFHQRTDARVNLLAAAAALDVAGDDLMERVVARAVLRRHAESLGEFLREHAHEWQFPASAVGHGQQLGADNGNHALLLDIFEQVVPEKFLRGGGGLKQAWRETVGRGASFQPACG